MQHIVACCGAIGFKRAFEREPSLKEEINERDHRGRYHINNLEDSESVDVFLRNGASLDLRYDDGLDVVCSSLTNNRLETFLQMIRAGANPFYHIEGVGFSLTQVLVEISGSGLDEELISDDKYDIFRECLEAFFAFVDPKMIEALKEDIESKKSSISDEFLEILENIIQNSQHFFQLAKYCSEERVASFLAKELEGKTREEKIEFINQRDGLGRCAVNVAASYGNVGAIEAILSCSDFTEEERVVIISQTDEDTGRNILHNALSYQGKEKLDLVDRILAMNPDLANQRDSGQCNALLYLCKNASNSDIYFGILLQKIIAVVEDKDAVDIDGKTSLHHLVETEMLEFVLSMILRGVRNDIADREGETVVDLISGYVDETMFAVLKDDFDPNSEKNRTKMNFVMMNLCSSGDIGFLEAIEERGFNIDNFEIEDRGIAYYSALTGKLELLIHLLEENKLNKVKVRKDLEAFLKVEPFRYVPGGDKILEFVERYINREDRSATKIQTAYKGYKERKKYTKLKKSAVKIQSVYKGNKVRKEQELRKKAATKIQAAYKGSKERKRYEELKESAVKIQKTYRGYKERKEYDKIKKAAIKIQNYYRDHKAKQELKERKNLAATQIQRAYRNYKERLKTENERRCEKIAALIQEKDFDTALIYINGGQIETGEVLEPMENASFFVNSPNSEARVSLLMLAIMNDAPINLLRSLINRGANVNVGEEITQHNQHSAQRPIHLACLKRQADNFGLLLNCGAEIPGDLSHFINPDISKVLVQRCIFHNLQASYLSQCNIPPYCTMNFELDLEFVSSFRDNADLFEDFFRNHTHDLNKALGYALESGSINIFFRASRMLGNLALSFDDGRNILDYLGYLEINPAYLQDLGTEQRQQAIENLRHNIVVNLNSLFCQEIERLSTLTEDEREYDYLVRIMQSGADVNHRFIPGFTACHLTCFMRDLRLLRLLLENGAVDSLSLFNSQGMTPLHDAINFGDERLVREIFKYNPNIDLKMEGHPSAFELSQMNVVRLPKIAEIFRDNKLKKDTDPNYRDQDGNNNIHLAVLSGEKERLNVTAMKRPDLLLETNNQGNTAFITAMFSNSDDRNDMLRFLVEKYKEHGYNQCGLDVVRGNSTIFDYALEYDNPPGTRQYVRFVRDCLRSGLEANDLSLINIKNENRPRLLSCLRELGAVTVVQAEELEAQHRHPAVEGAASAAAPASSATPTDSSQVSANASALVNEQ